MAVRVTTTIAEAASSYDLVTLAIVKEELGVTVTTSDAQIRRIIASSSRTIALHCDRVFNLETVVDTFEIVRARLQFSGEASLQLTRWPLNEDTTVTVTEAATVLEADVDYRVDVQPGLLYRLDSSGNSISWCASPVVVSYGGGYETIPADLQDAAIRLVRARWFAKDRDPLVRQESIPQVRDVSYWVPTGSEAGNIPPDVADLLAPYRVPNIG